MKVGNITKNTDALGLLVAIIVFCILKEVSRLSTFLLMIIGLSAGFIFILIHDKCKGDKK